MPAIHRLTALTVAAALSTTAARAAVIYNIDNEVNHAGFTQTSIFNFVGPATSSADIVAGELVKTYNTLGATSSFGPASGVFRLTIQRFGRINDATDATLANYELSFNARAAGLVGATATVTLSVDLGTFGSNPVYFQRSICLTSANQLFTFSLADLPRVGGNNAATVDTFNSGGIEVRLNTGFPVAGAEESFGLDNGNQYVIDNITIQTAAIPEPAALGLLAAGLVPLLRRRR